MALTDRELEILMLIAHGQSAKEAALACGIAPRTVESQLDAIRMKLGARNRSHMVAIAIASHILPFPRIKIQVGRTIADLRCAEPYG
jgi:DNA-binding CsgD family transcriptional regulator